MPTHKIYLEMAFFVDYDFQPEEEAVLYPNDSAYPGCQAEVTINSVQLQGQDIFLNSKDMAIVVDDIMRYETEER